MQYARPLYSKLYTLYYINLLYFIYTLYPIKQLAASTGTGAVLTGPGITAQAGLKPLWQGTAPGPAINVVSKKELHWYKNSSNTDGTVHG